ncbi:efflux RND transporter periplasmic adaptor subunit [Serratia microhaemolytica]|uniref:efflux RND transporter periplasmic adaptor subunit n=1 Tax=Serratia microhaemolytica TaxID=2675110 RepID=UPI000FDD21ED|nr:HlyD family efflux transporter periplasmic adaptor subunit [Serratia microhaemolytica]
MDISLAQTATRFRFRKYLILLIVAVAVVAMLLLAYNVKLAPYKIARSSLSVAEVRFGDFSVKVRGNGVLLPQELHWVAASVDGRIESVRYKAGARVKRGDLLVRMSNAAVEQQYQQSKLEYDALQAETAAKNAELKNNVLNQQAILLEAKSRLLALEIRLKAQEEYMLAVPRLEYETTRINMEHYRHQVEFEQTRLATLKQRVDAEAKANLMRLNKSASLLALHEQAMQSLNVTSPIDGVLQDISLQAGQRITTGSNIARLAAEKDLYAELKIPELHSRDLALGQSVSINTGRSQFDGKISRVDPAVINGTVKVDVVLTGSLPQEARPDLSIEGLIAVSEIDNTLFVERPPYVQNNIPSTLYKLDEKDKVATKTKVNFGQGSADFIQITGGLRAGDKIILSDSAAWQGSEQIVIME